MMDDEIINRIVDELVLCYESIGRKNPDSITIVASSIQDAVHFTSIEQVHEIFKRSKDIEPIPSQRTIRDVMKNYAEEFTKYDGGQADGTLSIEYSDPRSAWLPSDPVKRTVNMYTAIKNYCDAMGADMAYQYMKCHLTTTERHGDRRIVKWAEPEKATAFDEPIKDYLRYLYSKYLRSCDNYKGFPEGAKLNLGMKPPTVYQITIMLKAEGVLK